MELSFKDLAKRDVINVADGKCLGRICDLRLDFPRGELTGIVVPGKKTKWPLKCFDKCSLFIDQSRIIKIGGDVILVNLRCGEVCSPNAELNEKKRPQKPQNSPHYPPQPPCPPSCDANCSPCQPVCPPICPPQGHSNCQTPCPPVSPTCEELFGNVDCRIDLSDY